jgi:endoglucanase
LASYQSPTTINTEIIQSDEYLIASFHYYNPFNFTSSSTANSSNFNWGSESEKSIIINHFDQVKTWSDLNNIPVTLGEFGADNANGINYSTGLDGDYGGPVNSDRVEYHRFIAEQAINRGFSFSAWCSGNKSNKTIHLRTDNPLTSNAISGVWVTDVKDALLESGTWPLCYGPSIDSVILNPDFECGYSDQWIFSVQGSLAAANYSDASGDSYEGNVGGKVEVTNADVYNKVLLSNNIYTGDLTGKTITIHGYVKTLGPNQTIKIRIKSIVSGITTFTPSDVIYLYDGSLEGANYEQVEFLYDVPENTASIQVQLLFGQDEGIYLIDDFSVLIEDTSLGLDVFETDTIIKLFPNPSENFVTISTNLVVSSLKIFNSIGQLVHEQMNTNRINLDTYSVGNYILKIETTSGSSHYKKLFVK